MTHCASCGATGLHIEYRELAHFGSRPVLVDARGCEHNCLPITCECTCGAVVRRHPDGRKTENGKAHVCTPRPKPVLPQRRPVALE